MHFPRAWANRLRIEHTLVALGVNGLLLALTLPSYAHPGSGIGVTAENQIYFVDTGIGVWKLDPDGSLTLTHSAGYHWMALDAKGRFARSQARWEIDNGSFERITPDGAVPAVIISSDYPITVAEDGNLYYVPYKPEGPREVVRRTPDGVRSVVATLPEDAGDKPMRWVNGIASTPDGSIYFSDNDAVWRLDKDGVISAFREGITVSDCAQPMPGIPKLPYLRGLAVSRNGVLYAAATGCRSLIAIPAEGPIKIVLTADDPWSPTAVALSGFDVYALEYSHEPTDDRRTYIPRVRKISVDGTITTLTTIQRPVALAQPPTPNIR